MNNFSQILREYYDSCPERVSVHLLRSGQDDIALSYRDLLHGAMGYAKTYQQQGVHPGQVVVLILQHGVDLIYAFWGAVLIGAIPSIMPFLTEKLSPERYTEQLAALISVTEPGAIATYPEFAATLQKTIDDDHRSLPVIVSGQIAPPSQPEFDALPGFSCSIDEIALLQHSSGTTGLKKGVALSHRAVNNQLKAYGQAIKLNPSSDVIVSWLPLYHDMGLIACFIMPILRKIPLVLMSAFDWVRAPQRLLQAVSDFQGTLSWLPNFAYNFSAQKIRQRHLDEVDLRSWRAVINCSEPVKWESHQLFHDAFSEYGLDVDALHTSYAMAENTFGVTQSRISGRPVLDHIDSRVFIEEHYAKPAEDEDRTMVMMSSGVPIENTAVKVVDEEGNSVEERRVGEILIQSDCMLTGYYHRPEITERAFHDGWYKTGDYGYQVGDELFVTGRKKDLIIVGGKNIYPKDLEELAYDISGVYPGRAVAFGVYNQRSGTEDVVLVAESERPKGEERNQLANDLRNHITKNSPIALRRVEIVDPGWIVKTSSGKPSRHANKQKYLDMYAE